MVPSGDVAEKAAADRAEAGSMVDDSEYASSSKSFRLEGAGDDAGVVVKRYSWPSKTPFCVSEENFTIMSPSLERRADGVYALTVRAH